MTEGVVTFTELSEPNRMTLDDAARLSDLLDLKAEYARRAHERGK